MCVYIFNWCYWTHSTARPAQSYLQVYALILFIYLMVKIYEGEKRNAVSMSSGTSSSSLSNDLKLFTKNINK